jgi:chromosome segregation ATPase
MSIPEISATVAIAVAVGGALWALRYQGQVQTVGNNQDLQKRVRQAEATITLLLDELAKNETEHEIDMDKLRKDYEFIAQSLKDVQEELRDWKRRYERLEEENAALAKALGRV